MSPGLKTQLALIHCLLAGHMNRKIFKLNFPIVMYLRLASGIGSGNSTARHAREVGHLLHSDVFKKSLFCNQFQLDIFNFQLMFLLLWILSPDDTNENMLHNAAKRAGLSICDVQYLDLPICTGHCQDGTPTVEIQPWPFLLPSVMVPWIHL